MWQEFISCFLKSSQQLPSQYSFIICKVPRLHIYFMFCWRRFQTLPMIRIIWNFVFVHKSSGIFDFWKKYLDSMSDWRIMTIRYLKTSKKPTFLKVKILAPFEAQTWAVDLWWISVQSVKHDSFNFDFTKSSSAELRISSVWWVMDIRKFWKLA